VRFHSLPESKRYADTDAERAEILHRHHTILSELAGTEDDVELYVVSVGEGRWAHNIDGPPNVGLPTEYWYSLHDDEEDPESGWMHLYLSHTTLRSAELERILLDVADEHLTPSSCSTLP
jgi:hypothetical protein